MPTDEKKKLVFWTLERILASGPGGQTLPELIKGGQGFEEYDAKGITMAILFLAQENMLESLGAREGEAIFITRDPSLAQAMLDNSWPFSLNFVTNPN